MTSFKFRVVICRIRPFPTLHPKMKWIWSELSLKNLEINDVMIDQERKYEIRVQKAKEALNLLQEIAPELVPKPSVEYLGIEFSGPNYSLPIDEYFTMKAPLGTANRFE